MAPARRSPQRLSEAVAELARRLAPETVLGEVLSAWREVVGSTVAERARPVSERAGVLTISCESSVWAQELDLMGDVICERLNERLAAGRIARLRCVATPPEDPF